MLRWLMCGVLFVWAMNAHAESTLPSALQDWQDWVLHQETFRRCPFFANTDLTQANNRVCAWPEQLQLQLTHSGGQFVQRWHISAETWVMLPGDLENWPRAVTVNGAAAAVVARAGKPQLLLSKGEYVIAGRFQWTQRPESLAIPDTTGLVALHLDGKAITQVARSVGAVWLGQHRGAVQAQQINVQVYRLLRDDMPAMLTTQLRLQVAGEAREEVLSQVLPVGFIPTALNSALPARMDVDGTLRVQVRAGDWELIMQARAPDVATEITLPAVVGIWSEEEIWSFAANDRLRVAAVEGAAGIDPTQANVPEPWQRYPSYRFAPQETVHIVERSRGLAVHEDNQLQLYRQLYLDFSHAGFTAIDSIHGTMRSGWRLDMQQPYQLMSAMTGNDNLLVTQGTQPARTGVEWRNPTVALNTLSRISSAQGVLPASGWNERLQHVEGVLNLPPGHRLLAALGADSAPGAWIEQWRLLDLFLLLMLSVIAFRARGKAFAACVFIGVLLVYQENATLVWVLLASLLATVFLHVATEGRLKTVLTWAHKILLSLFLLMFVPFVVEQIRFALYPQLADWGGYFSRHAVTSPAIDGLEQLPRSEEEAPRKKAELAQNAPLNGVAEMADVAWPASVATTGGRNDAMKVLQRYAPGTMLQAGPGRPQWRYVSYAYAWNGPVDATQTVHFLIIKPVVVALWRIGGVLLLLWVLVQLVSTHVDWRSSWQRWQAVAIPKALLWIGVLLMTATPPPVQAANTPDPQLLKELHDRLLEPPQCAPACAEILQADVVLQTNTADISLQVSALTSIAVALPVAQHFELTTVRIDGLPAPGVYRDQNNHLWVALQRGVRKVQLSGVLLSGTVQLVFPQVPRSINVQGPAWDINGLRADRLIANTLELVRRPTKTTAEVQIASAQFPVFVKVLRSFDLGLDWTLTTQVQRLSPEKGGFTVAIPLLTDESVLTEGVETRLSERLGTPDGRRVLAGFDSNAMQFFWQSALKQTTAFTLTAAQQMPLVEVWRFRINPMWRVEFAGVPAALPENVNSEEWVFEYLPRPGESLQVKVQRPEAVAGKTLAIDNATLQTVVGQRVSEARLNFNYRSTQGGQHVVRLPGTAQVTAVLQDNHALAVRPDKGELPLALLPGAHDIEVRWQEDRGVRLQTTGSSVHLNLSSSNVHTHVQLPADRWVLFAGGAGVGPAILYWGELLVFIVLAILLARSTLTPLKMHEWLVLGLGLSTFSWSVLLLFAAWMGIMRWREQFAPHCLSTQQFRLLQVGLSILSVVAVLSLIMAIPHGLLATPDMRITGVNQTATALTWFVDQTGGHLPTPWVLSISLWWYKLAMLLWALWLSFALLRWVPFAWKAMSSSGFWKATSAANAD